MNVNRNLRHLYESLTAVVAFVMISSSVSAQTKLDPHEIYKNQNQSVSQEPTRQIPKTFLQPKLQVSNPQDRMCLSPTEVRDKLRTDFKNDIQIQSFITYFLEVRETMPTLLIPLYTSPDSSGVQVGALRSGDIFRVEESGVEYLEKIRADRKEGILWRKITVKDQDSRSELWFQYSWKKFHTLTAIDQPLEMTLRPLPNLHFQALYKKPGNWKPEDCELDKTLCVAWPDMYSKVYVLDFKWLKSASAVNQGVWWTLYYKTGVDKIDDSTKRKQDYGWMEARSAYRKIDQIPAYLYTSGSPSMENFLPSDEIQRNQSELFIFSENSNDTQQRQRVLASLGLSTNKVKGLSSIFDLTLAFKGRIGTSHLDLKQDFVSTPYTLNAVVLGGEVSSNLFLDLKMLGSLDVGVGVSSSNPEYGVAYHVDTQEWFQYVTPWQINEVPIELGVGAYYLGMISRQEISGFNSFVGLHAKVLVMGPTFGTSLRLAPVGTDLNLRPSNHLVSLGLNYNSGWKINKEPVNLSLEATDLNYNNPKTLHTTEYRLYQINMGFSF